MNLYKVKEIYSREKKRIYLYGASVTGVAVKNMLEKFGINVTAFLDGNEKKLGNIIDNCEVIDIRCVSKDSIIIITASNRYMDEIFSKLSNEFGFKNVFRFNKENMLAKTLVIKKEYSNGDTDKFEKKYQNIREKYKQIDVYFLWADRIGEMCLRLLTFSKKELNKNCDIYKVLFPYLRASANKVANERLLEIISRKLNIACGQDEEFWAYVLDKHFMDLNFENGDKYDFNLDASDEVYSCIPMCKNAGESDIIFSEKEIEEAEKKKNELGIGEKFVCLFARNSMYLANRVIENASAMRYQKHINMQFERYNLLIERLKAEGIQIVRVGNSFNSNDMVMDGVIDITGDKYDELLDLYLNSKCIRWIGSESGACVISQMFGKKALYVNFHKILNYYCILPYCKDESNLYIPKLYYSLKEKRYLNLYEMCLLNLQDIDVNDYLEKFGVEIREDSPEDICNAYIECEKKENGIWEYSEEERRLQDRYKQILEKVCKQYPVTQENLMHFKTQDCIMPLKIATTFLKKYDFLLN